MWSSLPALLLWMIKDKLDIFDNWRLAAVCRDWRSASTCYPKTLHTVGDGLPWIWNRNGFYFTSSGSREIISFARKSKFVIDRPEFVDATILFSKQGWGLVVEVKQLRPGRIYLVSILTGAKIELPDPLDYETFRCYGSFTTSDDGLPHSVFLVKKECPTALTIKTACPGDEAWTSHTYTGLARKSPAPNPVISIGQNVYFLDCDSRVTVFNVADRSCKELQPLPGVGFIAEHGGELIYVERRFSERDDNNSIAFDYSCFAVYRHSDTAPTLWEKLDKDAVMDTSWFMCDRHSCIAAKGNGLKVYDLRILPQNQGVPLGYVVSYDLLTGTAEILPSPFRVNLCAKWVDIG